MLRKWVPDVRTGETEHMLTIVRHVVARKIQSPQLAERSWRCPATSATRMHNSARYFGAKSYRHLYTVKHSLKMTCWGTSNQWRSWWSMWLRLLSVTVEWTPHTSQLTQLKEKLDADGCNLFLKRQIQCEKHTKHPYHVRGLNNVRSKCQTQLMVAEKISDAISGASPHQLSFFRH